MMMKIMYLNQSSSYMHVDNEFINICVILNGFRFVRLLLFFITTIYMKSSPRITIRYKCCLVHRHTFTNKQLLLCGMI